MRLLRKLLVGPLALVIGLSSVAVAQERHAVDSAAMAATLSEHVRRQDADRAMIREALGRPQVQEVAAKAGIDLGRLTGAIDTMSGDNLERAARAAGQVNDRLVGGATTIVLSTTTIIIGLLLLILIIVAVG